MCSNTARTPGIRGESNSIVRSYFKNTSIPECSPTEHIKNLYLCQQWLCLKQYFQKPTNIFFICDFIFFILSIEIFK